MIGAGTATATTCTYDDGAPALVQRAGNWVQVGVASFSAAGCDRPGGFAELTGAQLAWVASRVPAVLAGWGPCTTPAGNHGRRRGDVHGQRVPRRPAGRNVLVAHLVRRDPAAGSGPGAGARTGAGARAGSRSGSADLPPASVEVSHRALRSIPAGRRVLSFGPALVGRRANDRTGQPRRLSWSARRARSSRKAIW